MRPSLSLKVLLRTPFKTAMTFLLIAAASFALFSRVTDYAVTSREMTHAASYYHGVSALDNGVPNTSEEINISRFSTVRAAEFFTEQAALYKEQGALFQDGSEVYTFYSDMAESYSFKTPSELTKAQIDTFTDLPEVSRTDVRYMTAGIIADYKRLSQYAYYTATYNYAARFVVEATFESYGKRYEGDSTIALRFSDFKTYAGDFPETATKDIIINTVGSKGFAGFYRIGGDGIIPIIDNKYDEEFAAGLNTGDKCLLIGRWDTLNPFIIEEELSNITFILNGWLSDCNSEEYVEQFWLLNDEPDNYLETEKFAKVKEIIDITNQDINTFDMVYTSDMLSIPRFAEDKMIIQEGRALTAEDTDSCVVNYAFLKANKLNIGDTLSVELCDKLLSQNAGIGAVACIPERYGKPVKTVSLEIVGAYNDTDTNYERDADQYMCYSMNTIFVPSCLLPVDVPQDYPIYSGEFSVVIDNAQNIDSFLKKAEPLAAELDLTLRFSDDGWMRIKDNINISAAASLITMTLYIGASIFAMFLAVYLYIVRNKKAYAIMRALGTPRKNANRALSLPLGVLLAFAIPTGGFSGLVFTTGTITSALDNISSVVTDEYVPDASLPFLAIGVCFICMIAFLVILSTLFLRRFNKTPPLVLLQGDVIHTAYEKSENSYNLTTSVTGTKLIGELPVRRKYGAIRHVTRYIFLHIRRAKLKTAVAVILAVFLSGAMGLLAVTQLSYCEIFDGLEVKGLTTDFSSSVVLKALESEQMRDYYYRGGFPVICNGSENEIYDLNITNNIERFLQSTSSGEYTINYADGFDESIFTKDGVNCIIGNRLAESLGVNVGDTITMLSKGRVDLMSMSEGKSSLGEKIAKSSEEFTIAGVITSDDRIINNSVFAPLGKAIEKITTNGDRYSFPIEYGEFILADNEKPYELIDELDALKKQSARYSQGTSYYFNTTELDNVRRVRDMLVMLFPIAVTAALLIGAAVPMLIIAQSAKETAILRVLGTTKKRVRCMLAIEQISLCVVGIALAAGGLMLYNIGLFTRSAETLALCGVLYLLGCICTALASAVSVTKNKVLELLQVKE